MLEDSVRTVLWTFGVERARKEIGREHFIVLKVIPTNFENFFELLGVRMG
jgi:hypothetical protein